MRQLDKATRLRSSCNLFTSAFGLRYIGETIRVRSGNATRHWAMGPSPAGGVPPLAPAWRITYIYQQFARPSVSPTHLAPLGLGKATWKNPACCDVRPAFHQLARPPPARSLGTLTLVTRYLHIPTIKPININQTRYTMSRKLTLVVSLHLALSAAAPNPNDGQKRAPSPTLLERGPPYPTGPGYDAVPLSSIVPLSPGK